MSKIFERETDINKIIRYQVDGIGSYAEAGHWFNAIFNNVEFNVEAIQLVNDFERSSEGGGSTSILANEIQGKLEEYAKKYAADYITMIVVYNNIRIALNLNFDNWSITICTNKEQVNELKILAEKLGLEKGETVMTEEIESKVEEIEIPVGVQPDVEKAELSNNAFAEKLDAMQQAIATLQESFNDKIAEDAHKNTLFDNMHRELTKYQNGAMDKIVDTIALDIIQLVDTTKGHVRVYETKEANEENFKRLLRIVKGLTEDLQDILYRQNIESYRVEGHEVDVRRQKIIQTVPTDDQTKDNLIAVRAADGYEKDGKVLRPERIKIFKYSPDVANNSKEN